MSAEANLTWIDGLQFVGRCGDAPAVVLDHPESGGGPSPMQLLLISIAGCTGMDIVSIMKKKRADITRFSIHISGDRAEEYPKRYTHLHIKYILEGRGITKKALEQAIQLSESKYCSASASLNATVSSTYEIVENGKGAT